VNGVLIDSDVLIEVLRGRDSALIEEWSKVAAGDAPPACSPVSIAEIWCGTRPREKETIERLFRQMVVLPAGSDIGRLAGEFLSRYSKSHSVELGDALIAATAVHHRLPVWTRNRKHYPMPELRFY